VDRRYVQDSTISVQASSYNPAFARADAVPGFVGVCPSSPGHAWMRGRLGSALRGLRTGPGPGKPAEQESG